ncbi:hypothetical protein IU501_15085 [Nocardia otitidiscaviarum]|uniref:hypothetical protein n=1 Tax=Nocardia otitidiscaviarum TaxID=1823 RepID=UPI0018931D30|nr:hypothetical protein [Nocardia otitidiscaviarum]MBF6134320.1 hypothetical protein [Nocardia otitidiscaviarum]
MANHHRTDQRARCIHALQLRIEGHTWQSICETTSYWKTEAGARRAVGGLLDKWESETVDEYRTVQTLRYEALLKAWWPLAIGIPPKNKGDRSVPPDDKAAAVVQRTMDAINKLHDLNKGAANADGPRLTPDEFRGLLTEYVHLTHNPPVALTPAGGP